MKPRVLDSRERPDGVAVAFAGVELRDHQDITVFRRQPHLLARGGNLRVVDGIAAVLR